MGTIIEFTGVRNEPRREPEGGASRSAEIVIFPGIRVEYHTVDLSHRVMAVHGQDRDPLRR